MSDSAKIDIERKRLSCDFNNLFAANTIIRRLPIKILCAFVFPKYGVLYFHRKHKLCKLRNKKHGYIYYLLNYYLNHVDIGPNCDIGNQVKFPHPLAVVIGDTTVIKDNTTIMSCVTFGTNSAIGKEPAYPIVGENCYIGTGAKLIGAINI